MDGSALAVSGDGTADDWWRVVAVAAWDHLDTTGQQIDIDGLVAPERATGTASG